MAMPLTVERVAVKMAPGKLGKQAAAQAGNAVRTVSKEVAEKTTSFSKRLNKLVQELNTVYQKYGPHPGNWHLRQAKDLSLQALKAARTTEEALKVHDAVVRGLPMKADLVWSAETIKSHAMLRGANLIRTAEDANKVVNFSRMLKFIMDPFHVSAWLRTSRAENKAAAFLAKALR